jgi:hypothetical protein
LLGRKTWNNDDAKKRWFVQNAHQWLQLKKDIRKIRFSHEDVKLVPGLQRNRFRIGMIMKKEVNEARKDRNLS